MSSEHAALDAQRLVGPARAVRRGDQLRPRDGRRLQTSRNARSQESPGAARQNADQSLRRTEHAHAHLLRARRQTAQRRHRQHLRGDFQPDERRNAQGHRQGARSEPRRHHRPAAQLRRRAAVSRQPHRRERDQRRRRRARTSHPGLLDLYTIREKKGRVAGLHVAIIGDILFSRVARSNIFRAPENGRARHARRTEHARPARV